MRKISFPRTRYRTTHARVTAREPGVTGMSAHSTDSAAVIKFMTLFQKLKDWSENEPESLANRCIRLCGAAHALTMNERRQRELFAAQVNPKFRVAWRHYEEASTEARELPRIGPKCLIT